MPEPAPAWRGCRLRVAVVASGPHIPAWPTPIRAEGSRNIQISVSGCMSAEYQKMAMALSNRPGTSSSRGSTRSSTRPATGESTPAITAMGISSSADCVGVRPRASW